MSMERLWSSFGMHLPTEQNNQLARNYLESIRCRFELLQMKLEQLHTIAFWETNRLQVPH